MRCRFAVGALVAIALVAVPAVPAAADDRGGAFIDDNGNPTSTAEDRGPGGGGGSSGGGSDDGCTWFVLVEDDFEWELYDQDGNRRYSETGRWLAQDCPPGAPGSSGGIPVIPEGAEVDVEALTQEALSRAVIAPPSIATSPEADRRLYTQVPTWLWSDGTWWQGYSATATAGRVTSTVSASPSHADWTTGDGGALRCPGPGVPWSPGAPDTATYCKYTYRHSSAGQSGNAYTLSVEVTFEVSWSANTGQGGALPAITRTESRPVQVGEIQAVETG